MAKTIMVVDDSAIMVESIASMLLIFKNSSIVKASSGEDALDKLKAGVKPDLILTDLNMGGMDGIELIRRVRQGVSFKFTPIVLLTTESQMQKRAEAKAAGATGWLTKPVSPSLLEQVVRQYVPGV